jgi:hypothetical protein
LIVAKVSAENANGFGTYSQENTTGAIIQTVPGIPQPVFSKSTSTNTQAIFTWPALVGDTQTGGSPITSYKARLLKGGVLEEEKSVSGATVTFTGLTGGQTYTFIVFALNKYGSGTSSTTLSITTA